MQKEILEKIIESDDQEILETEYPLRDKITYIARNDDNELKKICG